MISLCPSLSVTQFAPAAAGSGIPEIKGYLNGVETHGILFFRTLIGKIFGSIGSVGGGLALGKKDPLVHTGAFIASLLGQYDAFVSLMGIYENMGSEGAPLTKYALLGAPSFLGSSMRMTAVGDAFKEGMYEEQARLRGIPLLESRPKYQMRKMTAREACGNQKVIDHARNGETLVIGLSLRSHLLVLLQSKVDFQNSPLPCDTQSGTGIIRHHFTEFVKPASSRGLSIEDIHLNSDDLEMYIDLAPFLNPSPYVVPKDMSLTKVYNRFRQLGLRHIFVVPRASRVIDLITRKVLLIAEDNEDSDTVELQSTSVNDVIKRALGILR